MSDSLAQLFFDDEFFIAHRSARAKQFDSHQMFLSKNQKKLIIFDLDYFLK